MFWSTVSILRIAHKYDMPTFRDRATLMLRTQFPSTLSAYDDLPPDSFGLLTATDLLSAIHIARMTNTVTDIIPCAFYFLTAFPLEALLRGCYSSQTQVDRETCIIGREAFLSEYRSLLLGYTRTTPGLSGSCLSWISCTQRCNELVLVLLEFGLKVQVPTLDIVPPDVGQGFCERCAEHQRGIWRAIRERLWKKLPGFFGMASWEALR